MNKISDRGVITIADKHFEEREKADIVLHRSHSWMFTAGYHQFQHVAVANR